MARGDGNLFVVTMRPGLLVLFVIPLSCTATLDVPAGTAITCATDAQCLDGQRCLLDIRQCVAPSQSCVVEGVDGLSGVTNGSACTKTDGSAGVCISGQCGESICGDRAVDTTIGEECDDGPSNSDSEPNACRTSCKKAGCGDSVMDTHEGCDDGNTKGADGCAATCLKLEMCGDGVQDEGESCDDANVNANDGCNQCLSTAWDPTILVGLGANGGSFTGANINSAGPLAIDLNDRIYIADATGRRIWKLDPSAGVATVIGGNGLSGTTRDGTSVHGNALNLGAGGGALITQAGDFVVIDNGAIREIDANTGVLETIAGAIGTSLCGSASVCPSGSPTTTALGIAGGMVVRSDGAVIYVEKGSHTVRQIQNGFNYVIMGTLFSSGSSFVEGSPGSDVLLSSPTSITIDDNDVIYVADSGNHRLLSYDGNNDATHLFAGNGTVAVALDGSVASTSSIYLPANSSFSMVVDRAGVVYFAESNKIRKIGSDGKIVTVAGDGTAGSTGDGGPAISARLVALNLAITRLGEIVFTESVQAGFVTTIKVRKITNDGVMHDLLTTRPEGTFDVGQSPLGTALNQIQGFDVGANGDIVLTYSGPSVVLRSKGGTGDFERVAGLGSQAVDGIDARDATLSVPEGIRLTANGDIVFADTFRHVIQRIDATTNVISTIAGKLDVYGFSGDGGPPTNATFYDPCDVELASNDDMYIYDCGNGRIRKVTAATGNVTTIVGSSTYDVPGSFCSSSTAACGDGGPGTSATLKQTDGQGSRPTVHVASNGDVFFSEPTRYRIRVLSAATGNVDTIAGNGTQCPTTLAVCGDGGAAASANLLAPGGFAFDGTGLLISDAHIRRMDGLTGTSTISFVGPALGGGSDGGDGGPIATAKGFGEGAIVKVGSTIYYNSQQHIRTIIDGSVDTISGLVGAIGDGPGVNGMLGNPAAIVRLTDERWLIADGNGNRVRMYDSSAQRTSTVVGHSGGFAMGGDPVQPQRAYYSDSLGYPGGLTFDSTRNVHYVSETGISNLQTLSAIGDVKTWTLAPLAGAGIAGFETGALATVKYAQPRGLAYDVARDLLWVADTGNHLVRAIDLTNGTDKVYAGFERHPGFAGDNGAAIDAYLNEPSAIAVGADGSIYIADTSNNRVRRIIADAQGAVTPESTIETVLGDGEPSASGEGTPAIAFSVQEPRGLVFDGYGDLWVSSTFTVRVITPGADGIAASDDRLLTVYGTPPRTTFPENATSCLSGLAPLPGDAAVYVVDACQGYLIRLDRRNVPAPIPQG